MPKWERISEVKSTFSMTFHPPLISIVVVFFFVCFFFLVTVVLLFCSLQPFWLVVWVVWRVSFQSFRFAVLGFNWYPIWKVFLFKTLHLPIISQCLWPGKGIKNQIREIINLFFFQNHMIMKRISKWQATLILQLISLITLLMD